ncbi:MAG: hypothetical protein IJK98_05985, partial [Clostridia bacterium]|nr:hypothetical protein [Clostridia bacterium]
SGKTVFKKKSTDEHGNKLMTKSAAVAAREAAIIALKQEKAEKPKPARHTVKEVFDEFCAEGRKDRAGCRSHQRHPEYGAKAVL